MDEIERATLCGAAARAQSLRDQAAAFRRLAATELLPEKKKLLLVAASRYEQLADQEQRGADRKALVETAASERRRGSGFPRSIP